jgi:hypothetical protein
MFSDTEDWVESVIKTHCPLVGSGADFLVIFSVFSKQHGREPEIVFSDFMSSVDRVRSGSRHQAQHSGQVQKRRAISNLCTQ